MIFNIKADFDFEADGLDHAFVVLALHFLKFAEDEGADDGVMLRGECEVGPASDA